MGMFDSVVCEYPLPDGFNDPKYKEFQTKDLDCLLETYIIKENGTLYSKRAEKQIYHNGTLRFYTSNVCAAGYDLVATGDDLPPWSREYAATFLNGELIDIKGGLDQDYNKYQHVTRNEWRLRTEVEREKQLQKHYKEGTETLEKQIAEAQNLLSEGKTEDARLAYVSAAKTAYRMAYQLKEPLRGQSFLRSVRLFKQGEEYLEALSTSIEYLKQCPPNDMRLYFISTIKSIAEKL